MGESLPNFVLKRSTNNEPTRDPIATPSFRDKCGYRARNDRHIERRTLIVSSFL